MSRRFRRSLAALASRCIALLSLAGFLAGTIGVPVSISAPIAAKDRSRPFPCQDRQCGCQNAEQCWRGCCCFTNREKLAWAKANVVTPPDYVATAAEQEEQTAQKAASCCESRGQSISCSLKSDACCETQAATSPLNFTFVLAIQARQCHGQAEQWLSLGAITPPPAGLEASTVLQVCGDLLLSESTLASVVLSIATPPPRA
jgi:hypothetical protein